MSDAFKTVGAIGLVLAVAGVVMLLMAAGDLHERLPTQVPPPWLARYSLVAAAALLTVAFVGLVFPGH